MECRWVFLFYFFIFEDLVLAYFSGLHIRVSLGLSYLVTAFDKLLVGLVFMFSCFYFYF
jgi:hypothetical protein